MDDVTVDKAKLIETLKKNRDEHQAIFDTAWDRYQALVIEEMGKNLDDAKNGRKIRRVIMLPEPENHTKDFDTAIAMLEWDQGGNVTISMRDFTRFVLNKWEWDQSFAQNTGSYLAS